MALSIGGQVAFCLVRAEQFMDEPDLDVVYCSPLRNLKSLRVSASLETYEKTNAAVKKSL
jgi:hypothetical protein